MRSVRVERRRARWHGLPVQRRASGAGSPRRCRSCDRTRLRDAAVAAARAAPARTRPGRRARASRCRRRRRSRAASRPRAAARRRPGAPRRTSSARRRPTRRARRRASAAARAPGARSAASSGTASAGARRRAPRRAMRRRIEPSRPPRTCRSQRSKSPPQITTPSCLRIAASTPRSRSSGAPSARSRGCACAGTAARAAAMAAAPGRQPVAQAAAEPCGRLEHEEHRHRPHPASQPARSGSRRREKLASRRPTTDSATSAADRERPAAAARTAAATRSTPSSGQNGERGDHEVPLRHQRQRARGRPGAGCVDGLEQARFPRCRSRSSSGGARGCAWRRCRRRGPPTRGGRRGCSARATCARAAPRPCRTRTAA